MHRLRKFQWDKDTEFNQDKLEECKEGKKKMIGDINK